MHKEELSIIEEYYGSKKAARSNVLLINHIHESLAVLDAINASDNAKAAFCIHPIVQNNIAHVSLNRISTSVKLLAKEYSKIANSYLCTPETDWIQTYDQLYKYLRKSSLDCLQMLYADKIQNRKDFRLYHQHKHPRSKELRHYFDLWILYLRVEMGNKQL